MTGDSPNADVAHYDRERFGAPSWVWLDRWSETFMRDESYPPVWDEMETEKYKPIIVWWGEDADV